MNTNPRTNSTPAPTGKTSPAHSAALRRSALAVALGLAGLATPMGAHAFNIYLEDTTLVTQSGIWRASRSSVGTDVSTTCSSVMKADHYINNRWMGGANGGQFTNGGATAGPAQLTYWRDGTINYLQDQYWISRATPPRTYTMRLSPLMNDSPKAPYRAMCDSVSIPVLETALTLATSGNFGKVASDHFSVSSSAAGTLRWLIVEKGRGWVWSTDNSARFTYPYPKALSTAAQAGAASTNAAVCAFDGRSSVSCSELSLNGTNYVSNTLPVVAFGSASLSVGANRIGFDTSALDTAKTYVLYAMVDDSAATSNYGRTYYQELTYAASGSPLISSVPAFSSLTPAANAFAKSGFTVGYTLDKPKFVIQQKNTFIIILLPHYGFL